MFAIPHRRRYVIGYELRHPVSHIALVWGSRCYRAWSCDRAIDRVQRELSRAHPGMCLVLQVVPFAQEAPQ